MKIRPENFIKPGLFSSSVHTKKNEKLVSAICFIWDMERLTVVLYGSYPVLLLSDLAYNPRSEGYTLLNIIFL